MLFNPICKRNFLHVLFFTLFACLSVPGKVYSMFDAPQPIPVRFALANLLILDENYNLSPDKRMSWHLTTGGARLFGLPEVQPFYAQCSGPGFNGRIKISGGGLSVGAYSEASAGAAYGRYISKSLFTEIEVAAHQVAIKEYGSAITMQVNGRTVWQVQPSIQLAFVGLNLNGARIGTGDYLLPRRFALGGSIKPLSQVLLFMELEKDTRYALLSRFGLIADVHNPVRLMFGFQTEPGIISSGVSCLIGSVRASIAFQYHPDLGISQCYGLAVSF